MIRPVLLKPDNVAIRGREDLLVRKTIPKITDEQVSALEKVVIRNKGGG